MKVIAFNGSARKNGNTSILINDEGLDRQVRICGQSQ